MASLVHTFLVKLVATFIGPEIAISFAMFANKWQVWFSFVNKDGFEGKSWHVFKNAGLWFFVVRRTKLTNQTTTLRQLDDNCFIFECSNLAAMYVDASVKPHVMPVQQLCHFQVGSVSQHGQNRHIRPTFMGSLVENFCCVSLLSTKPRQQWEDEKFIGNKCIELPDQLWNVLT